MNIFPSSNAKSVDASYASLRFYNGRVNFSGSLFTGRNCSCYSDPIGEQVSQLLGGREEYGKDTYEVWNKIPTTYIKAFNF